ncbi:MAG TPA: hypothetical protein VFK58_05605 [Sphingomicrobium sp.]|nr:hypothetical protein [Sphingomicrobium sp.]
MRTALLLLPLAMIAAPAAAQVPIRVQSAPQAAEPFEPGRRPPEMSDPRLAGRLVDALKVLSGAFLELPVGQAQAALEGRAATAAEKQRTVRSETGLSKQQLDRQLEASKPQMEASMKALVSALPAMMKGMGEAQKELERATVNMPQPGYPKR